MMNEILSEAQKCELCGINKRFVKANNEWICGQCLAKIREQTVPIEIQE